MEHLYQKYMITVGQVTIDVSRDMLRRQVTVIGLNDTVVVETPDAVLVVPKAQAQSVKLAVEHFGRAGRKEHIEHRPARHEHSKRQDAQEDGQRRFEVIAHD